MRVETISHTNPTKMDNSGTASHIVFVPDNLSREMTAQQYILKASVEGFEVQALCGYRWIPSRDPKRYPLCEKCHDVYKSHGRPDRDNLPDA